MEDSGRDAWGGENLEKRKKEKIYFITQIYYFNEQKRKIEFWDVRCIVKWYGIIDKVTFWDSKIRQDTFVIANALTLLFFGAENMIFLLVALDKG